MTKLDWIAVDWGTSRLRAWGCSAGGTVIRRASSGQGMGALAPEQFESALLDLIGEWLAPDSVTTVIACGMVGARQGWIEAPYNTVPCRPLAADRMIDAPVSDPRLRVLIIPGLSQDAPADVMRGEETQLAGLLANYPDYDGVICLPGTHSKWVLLQQGQVIRFQTFMTGELFALLSTQSVLRHGLHEDSAVSPWDDRQFSAGLDAIKDSPEQLTAELFAIRAEGLLQGLTPAAARSRLSGLLIGAELMATQSLWQDRMVSVVGDNGLANRYLQALRLLGANVAIHNADNLTLSGLQLARALTGAASNQPPVRSVQH